MNSYEAIKFDPRNADSLTIPLCTKKSKTTYVRFEIPEYRLCGWQYRGSLLALGECGHIKYIDNEPDIIAHIVLARWLDMTGVKS